MGLEFVRFFYSAVQLHRSRLPVSAFAIRVRERQDLILRHFTTSGASRDHLHISRSYQDDVAEVYRSPV